MSSAVITLDPGFSGTTVVKVSGNNTCGKGPEAESPLSVTETPKAPSISSDKWIYCRGESAHLQSSGGSVTWYKDGIKIAEGANLTIDSLVENMTVTACNQNTFGCKGPEGEFVISVDPITSDFQASQQWVMPEQKVIFTNLSSGAMAYKWDFGDGTTASSLENPTHYYFTQGSYAVTLEVVSANSCRDTVKKTSYITVSNTPSALDEATAELVKIYPNPVGEGRLFVWVKQKEITGSLAISLTELSGRVIISGRALRQEVNEIDLSGLSAGNYILSIYGKAQVILKLITVK